MNPSALQLQANSLQKVRSMLHLGKSSLETDFMSHLGKHSRTEYFVFSEMSASLKMQISKPFKEKWTQVFNSLNLCLNSAITAKPQDGSSSMHLPLQPLTSHHLLKLLVFTPKGKSDTKRFLQEWHHKDSFQVQAETRGKQKHLSNIQSLHSQLEHVVLLLFQRKLLPQIQSHPAQLKNIVASRSNALSEDVR